MAAAAVVLVFAGFVAGFIAAIVVWNAFGGGVWRSEVSVVEARLESPTELMLLVNSCGGHPSVPSLQETDIEVQVKVVASSTPFRGGCEGFDSVEVRLRQPLGDRVVVDKHTGQSVSVSRVN